MVRVHIPFVVRELTRELERITGLRLGVPVSAMVPPSPDEGQQVEATAHLHFECGVKFEVALRTGRGHFGQYIVIKKISCRAKNGLGQEISMGPGWEITSCETGPTGWNETGIISFQGEREWWAEEMEDGIEEDDAQFMN